MKIQFINPFFKGSSYTRLRQYHALFTCGVVLKNIQERNMGKINSDHSYYNPNGQVKKFTALPGSRFNFLPERSANVADNN